MRAVRAVPLLARLFVALALSGLAVGAIVGALEPREYRATAVVFVSSEGVGSRADVAGTDGGPQTRAHAVVELAVSPIVLDVVRKDLGLDEAGLAGRVTVDQRPGTALIDVTAQDVDSASAAGLAETVVSVLEGVAPRALQAVHVTEVRPAVGTRTPVPVLAGAAIGAGAGLSAWLAVLVVVAVRNRSRRTPTLPTPSMPLA